MQILHFRKSHIESVLDLEEEFENYLSHLSTEKREPFNRSEERDFLLRFGFGKEKSFSGYVAKIDNEIVGYALYHYGFDPYGFRGKCIYLLSIFVSEKARGKHVGKEIIKKLQSHDDSLGIYFGVWNKNHDAIEFYKRMGAEWCEDVPFMRILE